MERRIDAIDRGAPRLCALMDCCRCSSYTRSMAFLVCYSRFPPDDHTRDKAIYLNQPFYEIIFSRCRKQKFYELLFSFCRTRREPYDVLREIAWLRYKSPTIVIAGARLELLIQELTRLETDGAVHGQIAAFRRVSEEAIARGCALTISGDMYPELW